MLPKSMLSTIKWLYKPTTEYNLNLWNLNIWILDESDCGCIFLVEFRQHESIHTRDTVDGRNPASHLECKKNIVNNGINYLSGPINWCRISEPSTVSLIISMRCVSLLSCKFPGLATRDDWGSSGISSSLVAAHMRKDTVRSSTPQQGSEQRKQHTTAKWFSSLVDPKTSSHFGTMTNKM